MRLNRIKELYTWGDKSKAEYLAERQTLQARLAQLTTKETKDGHLERVAHYLNNMDQGWEEADQENRNRLAIELFEMVWIKDGIIQGVTPRPEMVPFFDLVHSEAVKDNLQWRSRRGSTS